MSEKPELSIEDARDLAENIAAAAETLNGCVKRACMAGVDVHVETFTPDVTGLRLKAAPIIRVSMSIPILPIPAAPVDE